MLQNLNASPVIELFLQVQYMYFEWSVFEKARTRILQI